MITKDAVVKACCQGRLRCHLLNLLLKDPHECFQKGVPITECQKILAGMLGAIPGSVNHFENRFLA